MTAPNRTAALDLSSRVILVTGGLGALGQVIVVRLRAHGARVAANDVLDQNTAAQRLPLGDAVVYVRGDAADPGEISHPGESVVERWTRCVNVTAPQGAGSETEAGARGRISPGSSAPSAAAYGC